MFHIENDFLDSVFFSSKTANQAMTISNVSQKSQSAPALNVVVGKLPVKIILYSLIKINRYVLLVVCTGKKKEFFLIPSGCLAKNINIKYQK